jgi:proteic killer suppression protein
VIKTFGNKETELIWDGEKSRKLPIEIQQVVRRKLRMINNAQNINDVRIPPANKLKRLKGQLSKYYSIRMYNSPQTMPGFSLQTMPLISVQIMPQ